MKKEGVLLIFLLLTLFLIPVILAAENETQVDKAYSCLENKVGNCESLSVEEQAFSLLALAHNSEKQSSCKKALDDKGTGDCWPSSGCRLRDTSLAILALDNMNSDTSSQEDWLLTQTKTPDLEWYLEIDALTSETSKCTISYSGSYSITINSNKKISGSAGSCLSLSQSGYWLKISDSCFNTNFTISCDKDFITTLLYKKPNADVWYVSSETNSASASGETQEQVNSACFEQSNNCNYEGSLWATLALSATNHDIKAYLPYLIAYSDDNKKLGPDAFLYMLSSTRDEYFTSIINSQNTQGYWNLGSTYNNYYDTALNLLAISNTPEAGNAKSWLFNVQADDDCWGSIRDTAFILYAAWKKEPLISTPSVESCTTAKFYCITPSECTTAQGNELSQYFCSGVGKICCDKNIVLKTCAEQLGDLCASDETCEGTQLLSSDTGTCCSITCTKQIIEETECAQNFFTCKSLCSPDTEEEKSFSCNLNEKCCGEKSKSYWWIWILIILIILVVVGIIFRDRIRMFLFKRKTGFKPAPSLRPGFPPAPGFLPRLMPRPMQGPVQRPTQKTSAFSSLDKELDDTLKKLREMGK